MRSGLTENNQEIIEAILEALGETMESLIFTEVEPVDPLGGGEEIDDPIWSSIDIIKPFSGKLTLVMPRELIMEITGDLFGPDLEGPPAGSLIKDTLAEMLNTIAGKLMSSLIGLDQPLELGLPETGEGPVDAGQAMVCRVNINDYDFCLIADGLV
jgi:CheY-specific phosphatase CheX